MEFSQIFQAIISLIFVLGLLLITLWFIKFCQQKGVNCYLKNKLKKTSRINILEHKRLDPKNSFVVAEYKGEEFLLLLGNNNLVLSHSSKPKTKGKSNV